jgi:alpha-L-fucosidase
MMRTRKHIIRAGAFGVILAAAILTCASAFAGAGETEAGRDARMKWWTDARFGMFIHFGLYALPARHEWVKNQEHIADSEYQKYFDRFNPDLYDPAAWAKAAKNAGMKYIVVTTKHHEGFCLWDSRYTDYKATRTPYGKDLIKPLVEAARAEGLKIGFYYSLLDWHHPEYAMDENHPQWEDAAFREKAKGRDQKKYIEYLHNQVREILTDFGKIDTLFMDFSFPGENGKGRKDWDSEKLIKMIRELQPDIIVDDRLDLLDVPGGWDYRTPEQFMPRGWIMTDGKRVPWETCQTFSGSWGYSRDEASWKSVRQLIAMLVETVSKGGNLILNVGPTARGTFDARATERLNGIGEWMKVNGRSIYGCTQAPDEYPVPQNCFLTYNPGTRRLYVHVLEWPIGALALDGLAGKVAYAQLLHDASEIGFTDPLTVGFQPGNREEKNSRTLTLKLPVKKPEIALPVIELFLK